MAKEVKQWFSITNEASGVPEIKLFGFIGPWAEVDYESFSSEFRRLESLYGEAVLRIHCAGGNMFEGFSIYDMIRNSKMKTKARIEGMAASMGSIIALACDVREINKYGGRFMTHKVQGCICGESDQVRNYADLMDNLEKKAIQIYMERTGQDEETVKGWLKSGIETWHDADDAVKLGLATTIVESESVTLPENKLKDKPKTEQELWALYNVSTNQNQINNQMKDIKVALIAMLAGAGITASLKVDDADEKFVDAVKNALDGQKTTIADLKKKLKDAEDANEAIVNEQAETLVNNAITEGKILASDKEDYLALAKSNPALAAKTIGKLPGKVDINNQLNQQGGGSGTDPKNARKDWDFEKWSQEDPTGLKMMKSTQPEKYDELFNACYGE